MFLRTTEIQLKELPSLGEKPIIEDALRMIRGVENVRADLEAGLVVVKHEESVNEAELLAAVRATGVAAELAQERHAQTVRRENGIEEERL